MTDNEIIKALECCKKDDCDNCHNNFGNCYANLSGYSLDLIKRKQAEIDRLERYNEILTINADTAFQDGLNEAQDLYAEQVKDEIKSEAIKEFAEMLNDRIINFPSVYPVENATLAFLNGSSHRQLEILEIIDNLAKEWMAKQNDR